MGQLANPDALPELIAALREVYGEGRLNEMVEEMTAHSGSLRSAALDGGENAQAWNELHHAMFMASTSGMSADQHRAAVIGICQRHVDREVTTAEAIRQLREAAYAAGGDVTHEAARKCLEGYAAVLASTVAS